MDERESIEEAMDTFLDYMILAYKDGVLSYEEAEIVAYILFGSIIE